MKNDNKKKSKKIVIIVSTIIISVIIGMLILNFVVLPIGISQGRYGYQVNNWYYSTKLKYIDKDIVIELHDRMINCGGYSETNNYFYIDIDKKKIYEVEDYFVFGLTSRPGEGGHHYTINSVRKLTNEQINETIDFINKQINNKDSNVDLDQEYYDKFLEKYEGMDRLEKMMFIYGYDYVITYKEETIIVEPIIAPIINQITGKEI